LQKRDTFQRRLQSRDNCKGETRQLQNRDTTNGGNVIVLETFLIVLNHLQRRDTLVQAETARPAIAAKRSAKRAGVSTANTDCASLQHASDCCAATLVMLRRAPALGVADCAQRLRTATALRCNAQAHRPRAATDAPLLVAATCSCARSCRLALCAAQRRAT
jgi:hypothetical protein